MMRLFDPAALRTLRKDQEEKTILDIAISECHIQIMQYLEELSPQIKKIKEVLF